MSSVNDQIHAQLMTFSLDSAVLRVEGLSANISKLTSLSKMVSMVNFPFRNQYVNIVIVSMLL